MVPLRTAPKSGIAEVSDRNSNTAESINIAAALRMVNLPLRESFIFYTLNPDALAKS